MIVERSMADNWLSNTYLVAARPGSDAFLVDAGGPLEPLLAKADEHGVDHYDLGTGYNHIALTVDDLDGTLANLAEKGIEPEKPPYRVREGGNRICFVRDPDGYRIELIETR